MAEIVFDYSVVSVMNEAEKEKYAVIASLHYILYWNGERWQIEDTATGKVANVYVSVV